MAKEPKATIGFAHLGIATVLKNYYLEVPDNQREYKWEQEHIADLFGDLTDAISSPDRKSYFLGTIVLTPGKGEALEIADGQQRLATTSILLAAIRDHFFDIGQAAAVGAVEIPMLFEFNSLTMVNDPKLTLNVDDRGFFRDYVLARADEKQRQNAKPAAVSHKRIALAAKLAKEHVQNIIRPHSQSERVAALHRWVHYLKTNAQVVVLTVSDDLNAFDMFETLNDRGLKTSQSDLLKNYLFKEADDRKPEAKKHWESMKVTLEGFGDDDETVIAFLRMLTILHYGFTKERDFFRKLKGHVKGVGESIKFITSVSDVAGDYAATLTQSDSKWNAYHPDMREYVKTLRLLRVNPIRFLMLAVTTSFPAGEAEKAFRAFVCWSVRLLIVGGGRSGVVEETCANAAKRIYHKETVTAEDLADELKSVIPLDVQFKQAFAMAEVTQHNLARYYLRAMERQKQNAKEPFWVPNEKVEINLEHVLPQNPGPGWNVKPEVADAYYRRLGNMALLQASKNNRLGNKSYAVKRPILAAATYHFTKQIGKKTKWTPKDIDERQAQMSETAAETWPVRPF